MWPELARFDEIAVRAERLARTGNIASLGDVRAELVEAGRAVTAATIPSNATHPEQVKPILADLASLIDDLSSDLDDESLATLVQGFHPVIESLMEAAGMPHDHDDHDHGDHDHGDHNHDDGDHDHGAGDENQTE